MGSRDQHEGLACLHRYTGNNTSTSTRREPLPNSDRRGAGIGLPPSPAETVRFLLTILGVLFLYWKAVSCIATVRRSFEPFCCNRPSR